MSETPDLERHYVTGFERGRLLSEDGTPRLELVRSLELLHRFLPPAPADVLDVGGFHVEAVLGIEGPAWLVENQWDDPARREQPLFAARAVEAEPSLGGLSSHLLAAAVKP